MPHSIRGFAEIQSNDDDVWVGRQKLRNTSAAVVEPDGRKANEGKVRLGNCVWNADEVQDVQVLSTILWPQG